MTFSHRPHKRAYAIWLCAVAFYFYQFILRVSPGVMLNDLMIAFHATASEVGEMASIYLIFYSLLQIPLGILMDRWGARAVLALVLGIMLLGSWLFGHATSLSEATMGRMLIGIGSAPAFIGCSYVIRQWFSQKYFNIMLSITMAVGTLGAVYGGIPLAWMIERWGWRTTFFNVTIMGFLIWLLVWAIVRERKDLHPQEDIAHESSKVFHNLVKVMKIPQIWLTAIAAFGMYLPLSVFGDLWGVNYLMSVMNFSHLEASGSTSLIYVGVCAGGPCAAWLSQSLGSRRRAILFNAFLMLGGLVCLVILPPMSTWCVNLFIFSVGFGIGSEVLCFAICCDWVSKRMTGVTVGFVNTITMAGGAFLQSSVGLCLDALWDGQLALDGLRLYSASSYRWSMAVLVICVACSIICLFYVREHKVDGQA